MKDAKTTKISNHWSRFADETTLHGCKHVRDSQKPKCFKFLWAAVLILMIAALMASLAMLWIRYSSYPFLTVWKLSRETSLTLPEISMCLRGEFDMDKVKSWDAAADFMKLRWSNDWSNSSNEFLQLPYSDALSRFGIDEREVFLTIYMYDLGAFKRLPITDWLKRHPEAGRACWRVLKKYVDINGIEHQFKLEMLNSIMVVLNPMISRLEDGHTAVGIEMFFHQPGSIYWVQRGISLSPGSYADVRFTHEHVRFLPLPYKSAGSVGCLDTEDAKFTNPLNFHNAYSFDLCIQELLIDRLQNQCGCLFQPFASRLNVKECTVLQYHLCYLSVQSTVLREAIRPDIKLCIGSCVNINYKTHLSYSGLETESLRNYLPLINGTNVSVVSESDMKNLIFIQIQPLSLDVTTVEHIPEMTLLDIVAQIGGFMGLFLGASLITWMELFDVALQIGWVYVSTTIRRLRGKA
ncbi:hypothetical protein RRG08_002020 [Elysia crispata]|uniref:Uncharacterized protein n=1 Tax=Elysia crispata TaxID=231223 RepID=A0AAE1AFG7_9GAST|nr:hypothetical protein RRG08_002020 [Elysia crispata]